MAHIGFDFDGTLSVWLPGVKPDYTSGQEIFRGTAAVFSVVHWLKKQVGEGHQVSIITGRSQYHAPWLRLWCKTFLGFVPTIHCRPSFAPFDWEELAAWKSLVIQEERVAVYVGDNDRIDREAARMAKIRYICVTTIKRRKPPTPDALPSSTTCRSNESP